jgi:hypothetical protein
MLADILDLDELNTQAQYHPIGQLQVIRKDLKGLRRLSSKELFDRRTRFPRYAFHYGGRKELQFNVGLETMNATTYLRSGVAFSLERGKSLPDPSIMVPKVRRFNEFLRINSEKFRDLLMWTWPYPHRHNKRSPNYTPMPVPPELIKPRILIVLGRLQQIDNIDIELILTDFDRLLPLYEFVEGTAGFPCITDKNVKFDFKPGCPPRLSQTNATITEQKLNIYLRHNKLQETLYKVLSQRFGPNEVGIERPTGTGVIVDLIVRNGGEFWFYEIKTGLSARGCIREALAQLLEYSYWPGSIEASRLIVVGEPALDSDADSYLSQLRERFFLPLYYQQIDVNQASLNPNNI